MTSIASAIARHRLAAATVVVVVPVAVVATAAALSGRLQSILDSLVIMLVGGLGFTVVGSLILRSRPGLRIGRLMALIGVSLVLSLGIGTTLEMLDPFGFHWWGTDAVSAISETFGVLVLLGGVLIVAWFPDGRTTSRLGIVAQALTGIVLLYEFADLLFEAFLGESPLPFLMLLTAYAVALADLLARYQRADGIRRTQIRWVLASGAVSSTVIVAVLLFGERLDWLFAVWVGSTMLPAVAVGIAITRYRLYEIDRIISRTLTYAGVTVALFVVFVAANLVAQWALSPFTSGNALAVAGSTLLAAAAFSPMRSRLQMFVDRRFNRSRYDAERTIDAFASRLRDQLDLPTVSSALEQTALGAVEPMFTAIWLRRGISR